MSAQEEKKGGKRTPVKTSLDALPIHKKIDGTLDTVARAQGAKRSLEDRVDALEAKVEKLVGIADKTTVTLEKMTGILEKMNAMSEKVAHILKDLSERK